MITQIYEIQSSAEAEQCIELGVDHIGTVLISRDQWKISELKEVMGLTEGTRTKNLLLPLFTESAALYRALDFYRPHYVHLCDTLTTENGRPADLEPHLARQSQLRKHFPEVGIIRTIPIPAQNRSSPFSSLSIADQLEPVTDVFLTDTWLGQAPVEGYIGITGIRSDWTLARELAFHCRTPVILAGGLSPDNVFEAATTVLPAGVDSCTLTNRVDPGGGPVRFQKDFHKVTTFIREVRRAEAALQDRADELRNRLDGLKLQLREQQAALPAHSVNPGHLTAIEALEDEIALHEQELKQLDATR